MTSSSYSWISSMRTTSETTTDNAGKLIVSLTTAQGASYKPFVSYQLRTRINNPEVSENWKDYTYFLTIYH